jgi:hypothetical protein
LTIGGQATSLAFPQHDTQAFHDFMMCVVPISLFGSEQVHGLSNAPGLIDGTLLADGQVHGQMQKRVGLTFRELGVKGQFFLG